MEEGADPVAEEASAGGSAGRLVQAAATTAIRLVTIAQIRQFMQETTGCCRIDETCCWFEARGFGEAATAAYPSAMRSTLGDAGTDAFSILA